MTTMMTILTHLQTILKIQMKTAKRAEKTKRMMNMWLKVQKRGKLDELMRKSKGKWKKRGVKLCCNDRWSWNSTSSKKCTILTQNSKVCSKRPLLLSRRQARSTVLWVHHRGAKSWFQSRKSSENCPNLDKLSMKTVIWRTFPIMSRKVKIWKVALVRMQKKVSLEIILLLARWPSRWSLEPARSWTCRR